MTQFTYHINILVFFSIRFDCAYADKDNNKVAESSINDIFEQTAWC